jgi:hypothetical protein
MIITETVKLGKREFRHTYSDAGFMILQNETGLVYEDAYDLLDAPYTYTETDEPIPEF